MKTNNKVFPQGNDAFGGLTLRQLFAKDIFCSLICNQELLNNIEKNEKITTELFAVTLADNLIEVLGETNDDKKMR